MTSESGIHTLNGISCVRIKNFLIGVDDTLNKKLLVN